MNKTEKNEATAPGAGTSQEKVENPQEKVEKPKGVIRTQSVLVKDLKRHPAHKEIYSDPSDEQRKELAADVKERGLTLPPTTNEDFEILSGYLRVEALKDNDVETVDVLVMEIDKEDETEVIVASNPLRKKSIHDERNEVLVLRKQYLKRSGENGNGEHTNIIISQVTGYSTDRIAKIVKIEEQFPKLFDDIAEKKMSLHAACEKAKLVQETKKVQDLSESPVELPEATSDIKNAYSDAVKDLAEKNDRSELIKMIDDNVLDPKTALNSIKENIKYKNTNGDEDKDSKVPPSTLIDKCPLCGAKVKKNGVKKKLTKHSPKIVKLRDELGIVA